MHLSPVMVQLNEDFFTSLRPSKHFPWASDPISANSSSPSTASLDFDSTGEHLLSACSATDSIHLFGCEGGESKKIIQSKKYGVGQVKFAHRSTTVIYSSTKGDDSKNICIAINFNFNFTCQFTNLPIFVDDIRYLSIHDNKYLRYFRGHKSRVTQLALSPLNDIFLSVAPSESLCLWDLRTAHLQGRLHFSPETAEPQALAAFDPQGLIFAVATGSKYLRLYDARNWERGAFTTFELSNSEVASINTGKWNNLQFSPDGKEILIGTGLDTTVGIILDSFDGNVKGTIESADSTLFNGLIYTPDSKFIIGGRTDGQLNVWSPSNPKSIVETIEGVSREPISALAFNPKFAMLATVGDGTVFYI